MFRKLSLFVSTLIFPLFLSGCFVLNLFDFGPSIDLGKNQWRISSFSLDGVVYEDKNLEEIPTMRFDTQEMKVYGNTGCNTFFANYVWMSDKVIEMRGSGMTRKMCASEDSMKFEQKLMEEFDGEFEITEVETTTKEKNLVLKKDNLIINLTPFDPANPNAQESAKQETAPQDASAQTK